MQTLLIFENVPEETLVFLIPDAPEWVALAHGHYINTVACPKDGPEREALDRVNDAITEKKEWCGDPESEWACAFRKYAVPAEKPIVTRGAVKVVRCGFLL